MKKGQKTVEDVYLITSDPSADSAVLAGWARGHWEISTSRSATLPAGKTNPWSEPGARSVSWHPRLQTRPNTPHPLLRHRKSQPSLHRFDLSSGYHQIRRLALPAVIYGDLASVKRPDLQIRQGSEIGVFDVTQTTTRQVLRVESAEAVLGLHWFVARDFTLRDEGIDCEILLPAPPGPTKFEPTDPRYTDQHLVKSINYQSLFAEHKVDIYRACEWGQIRRTYDNPSGPIVMKRPAHVCQAIFVRPDSDINSTVQLANVPVGVQFHQGSHYTTLGMLEGFVRRDEISVVHAGKVQERYEALMNKELDAITLMEPWISLAQKHGCKRIAETHYQGVENATREMLESDMWERVQRALRKAVALINEDPKRYVHYMIDEIPEKYRAELTLDDFYLPRLRYANPEPYEQAEFERRLEWMVSWDLVGKDADYSTLVCNVM